MDRTKAAEILHKARVCYATEYLDCHMVCDMCKYHVEDSLVVEAMDTAIAALVDKDTNVPTKWIPVSERMPEKDGIYLVSGGGKVWSAQCLTFGCFRGWSNDVRNPTVSAWMPLPESWKGDTK